ncbi:MAG: hypothetical protein JRC86_07030 [Deltaproteobacteria bacterium]|nr:hypothetical protein [Deltaproteobacteria bacterium]
MARAQGQLLDAGDPFPSFEFNTTEGSQILLPRDFDNKWTVVLILRGHW